MIYKKENAFFFFLTHESTYGCGSAELILDPTSLVPGFRLESALSQESPHSLQTNSHQRRVSSQQTAGAQDNWSERLPFEGQVQNSLVSTFADISLAIASLVATPLPSVRGTVKSPGQGIHV